MNDLATLNERQLTTLKATIARQLNASEFNLFVEYCRNIKLDPIRKQVVPILFNADRPDKRQMTIVVTIDGLRAIAARTGQYRPDETAPVIAYRDDLKDPNTNPLGIEKATVRVFKQDSIGAWHPISAEAYWDEFAPVKQWQNEPAKLDGKTLWPSKPRIMICKCAEAQALRKGWPDQFAGVYGDAELELAAASEDASAVVERFAEGQRMKMIGGERAISLLFDPDIGIERIPVGQVADRMLDAARRAPDLNAVATLRSRNADSLREFWAHSPTDAHELKRELEAIEDKHRGETAPRAA